jgi:small neutral amino acid transporter SnatA (MarC family)
MITPIFVFTIFMLTLGPIKTVPGFFLMTKEMDAKAARALAIRGTLIATTISLLVAIVMRGTAAAWQVSLDELRIAGGILLFIASRNIIEQFNRPLPAPAPSPHPAVTPLAIPTIVTPWGVVAILLFVGSAAGDLARIAVVIGILLLTMVLNLIGMLLARQIIGLVGFVAFQVVGWVFAVLQAGLAVEAVVVSLRHLGLFRLGAG